MKKEIIGVLIALVLAISIWFMFFYPKIKAKPISNIKELVFHYTEGYAVNAYVNYELICGDKCVLKYKLNGVPEKDAKTVDFPKERVLQIIDMLNKYNVSSWDGFNKNAKDVLDGDSFTFKVSMSNGDSIYATGYMLWPNNYREVKKELEEIFNEVIK